MKKILLLSLLIINSLTPDALACLSCGCESSGSSSDIGAMGGASTIFAKGKKFILQFGSNMKSINGTFNEIGNWNPTPVDSSLYTMQNVLGVMYFPTNEVSVGLQIPVVSNFLSKAAWGSFGSIAPTDIENTAIGSSLGDISAQATYKVYENDLFNFASAVWGRFDFPTGQATGNPEFMSGSGVPRIVGGLLGIKKFGNFELLGNVSYQVPLGKSAYNTSSFSVGNAFMYQLQSNYQFMPDLKAGIGFSGVIGQWLTTGNNNSMTTSKIKLIATSQYDFSMYNGIGLSIGYDPKILGKNTMTDTSMNIVFYQYI